MHDIKVVHRKMGEIPVLAASSFADPSQQFGSGKKKFPKAFDIGSTENEKCTNKLNSAPFLV